MNAARARSAWARTAERASTTTADSGYAEFEIHRPFVEDRVSIIS